MTPIATLAKLSDNFYVNPKYIVKVEIISSAEQAKNNGIHYRTSCVVDNIPQFTVTIHIRSETTNADRFYKYFTTKADAQSYVNSLFTII